MTEFIIILAILTGGIFSLSLCTRFRKVETISEHETGLLYRHGVFCNKLDAGRHVFWGFGHEVLRFDTRLSEMVVQGQEVLTSDRATVKVTAVATHRIADPVLYHQTARDANQCVYTAIQLALRELVATQELEDVVAGKQALGAPIAAAIAPTAEMVGVEVVQVAIRDLMFGGDLKSAFSEVIAARERGKAELEKARAEAASLRTLANASRVFENNPQLMQLRYLKAVEHVGAGGFGDRTLVLGRPEDWAGPEVK